MWLELVCVSLLVEPSEAGAKLLRFSCGTPGNWWWPCLGATEAGTVLNPSDISFCPLRNLAGNISLMDSWHLLFWECGGHF